MEAELARFCSLCGCFRTNYTADSNGDPLMSPVWERAYSQWQANPPVLWSYQEQD